MSLTATSTCAYRLLLMRTAASCCTRVTMITSQWSCTGGVSGSATTLDPTRLLQYTGFCSRTCLTSRHCNMRDVASISLSLFLSVETVNDGSFHSVELVAADQTLSLSIDGGPPKSISSISKQSTLNLDSPLYLGGRNSHCLCLWMCQEE